MKNFIKSNNYFISNKILIITLSLVLVILGYFYNKSQLNNDFIDRGYNLDKFRNKLIFSRGLDSNDNLVLLIYNLDYSHNGPYVVKVNLDSGFIAETSKKLVKDTTIINSTELENLALEFNKLNVEFLAVDSNYNYYINVTNMEYSNLVKFSNIKFKTKEFDVGWKNIGDNWYERIE